MAALSSSSFTEDFSSDSDLDENELDHLVTAQVPQNTQNSTRWAVKAFEGKLKFIYLFSNKISFICRFWFKYYMYTVNRMCGSRGGGQEVLTPPVKSQKYRVSWQYTSESLKNHKVTKPAFSVWPSSERGGQVVRTPLL